LADHSGHVGFDAPWLAWALYHDALCLLRLIFKESSIISLVPIQPKTVTQRHKCKIKNLEPQSYIVPDTGPSAIVLRSLLTASVCTNCTGAHGMGP
jgi:hypothetical protein